MKKTVAVLLILLAAPIAKADFEKLSVLALSPQDNRAVVRLDNGNVEMLAAGDQLLEASIMQVLADKLVLKDSNGELVWLLKSIGSKPSQVRRFHSSLPQQEIQQLRSPVVVPQSKG